MHRPSVLLLACLALIFAGLALTGCEDDVEPTTATLLSVDRVGPGDECELGGQRLHWGFDNDRNGDLDPDERIDTYLICNFPIEGEDGIAGWVRTTEIPFGSEECLGGGYVIESGVDADNDGVLADGEVDNTEILCHGDPGFDALFSTTPIERACDPREQPSPCNPACPHGGYYLHEGLDLNRNGTLDEEEVDSTTPICTGMPGYNAILRTTDIEVDDERCPHGGVLVENGYDVNANGVLDDGEVLGELPFCAPPSVHTLVNVEVVRENDADCPYGGLRVDLGLDNGDGDDGQAFDRELQAGEVDESLVVCNGANPFPENPVGPPDGPPGQYTINTVGGNGCDEGGDGGSFVSRIDEGSLTGHIQWFDVGRAQSGFTRPGSVVTDTGPLPLEVDDDVTVSVFPTTNVDPETDEDDGLEAHSEDNDGVFHTHEGDDRIYVYSTDVDSDSGDCAEFFFHPVDDGEDPSPDDGCDLVATGIDVASGALLTFEPNCDGVWVDWDDVNVRCDCGQQSANIEVEWDVRNEGTITVGLPDQREFDSCSNGIGKGGDGPGNRESTDLDGWGLALQTDTYYGAVGSSIDLRGLDGEDGPGDRGGNILLIGDTGDDDDQGRLTGDDENNVPEGDFAVPDPAADQWLPHFGSVFNDGSILADGGDGFDDPVVGMPGDEGAEGNCQPFSTCAHGGDAGQIWVWGATGLINTGPVSAVGGNGDPERNETMGGDGGPIHLDVAHGDLHTSGNITSRGGDGIERSGSGGEVTLQVFATGDLRNNGTINTRGGHARAFMRPGCVGGEAGDGGDINLIGWGADIANGASLITHGGESDHSNGGWGGDIYFFYREGCFRLNGGPNCANESGDEVVWQGDDIPNGRIQVSGNINTGGGRGHHDCELDTELFQCSGGNNLEPDAGRGGTVYAWIDADHVANGQEIQFLGYTSATLNGGQGLLNGGNAGHVFAENESSDDTGSVADEQAPSGGVYNWIPFSAVGGPGIVPLFVPNGGFLGGFGGNGGAFELYSDEDTGFIYDTSNTINYADIVLNGGPGGFGGGNSGAVVIYGYTSVENHGRIETIGGEGGVDLLAKGHEEEEEECPNDGQGGYAAETQCGGSLNESAPHSAICESISDSFLVGVTIHSTLGRAWNTGDIVATGGFGVCEGNWGGVVQIVGGDSVVSEAPIDVGGGAGFFPGAGGLVFHHGIQNGSTHDHVANPINIGPGPVLLGSSEIFYSGEYCFEDGFCPPYGRWIKDSVELSELALGLDLDGNGSIGPVNYED